MVRLRLWTMFFRRGYLQIKGGMELEFEPTLALALALVTLLVPVLVLMLVLVLVLVQVLVIPGHLWRCDGPGNHQKMRSRNHQQQTPPVQRPGPPHRQTVLCCPLTGHRYRQAP